MERNGPARRGRQERMVLTHQDTSIEIRHELPEHPSLGKDEVHVWRFPLEPAGDAYDRLLELLSPDEVERARRFVFPEHRRRFVVCHGRMRETLARYLGVAPDQIVFRYGEHGKPSLASDGALHFNLSHSHELAVLAVGARTLGADVEHLRPLEDHQRLADRFFTERESASLRRCRGEASLETFFYLWTCKEAYLKAIGKGLAKPLSDVEVSLPSPGADAFVDIGGDRQELARWSLRTFTPEPGYCGALVVDGRVARTVLYAGV